MCECKSHQMYIEKYSRNPSTCICKNGKYLGSIYDNFMISCDGIINAAGNVPANVTITGSANFYNKKVWYEIECYIMHTVLLVIIIAIYNCYHLLSLCNTQI